MLYFVDMALAIGAVLGPILTTAVLEAVREAAVPSTGAHTPQEGLHIPQIPAIDEGPSWQIYEVTTVVEDYYLKKLLPHFNRVNSVNYNSKFRIIKSRRVIHIYEGDRKLFNCPNNLVSQRNLYLELHSFNYDVPTWISNRHILSDFDYRGTITPPDATR